MLLVCYHFVPLSLLEVMTAYFSPLLALIAERSISSAVCSISVLSLPKIPVEKCILQLNVTSALSIHTVHLNFFFCLIFSTAIVSL